MRLYYFTASFPYGLGELWKSNELEVLVNYFEEIIVIPYSYDGNIDAPKQLPKGVILKGPLFMDSSFSVGKVAGVRKVILSELRGKFFKEFFVKRAYQSRFRFVSWLNASVNALRLLKNPVIIDIISELNKETILYFFWGKGAAEFLPFVDTKRCFKTFVRMHRYDLFETVNHNYIPYRRPLLESIDIVAPSSEAGRKHLQELYPDLNGKIKLFRLGTIGNGKQCIPSSDNVFRIVSCSYLSKVKRVDVMVESLQYLSFPIIWRHVGDGALRKEIEELIVKFGLQDKFIIEGLIDTRQVLEYYTSNTFDLFVNVSTSEGVPFSIMEAFSVSLPVMATNVGGTSEIVDDTVGKILESGIDARGLAMAISEYFELPSAIKAQKRKMAFRRSEEMCDAVKLSRELSDELRKPGHVRYENI